MQYVRDIYIYADDDGRDGYHGDAYHGAHMFFMICTHHARVC